MHPLCHLLKPLLLLLSTSSILYDLNPSLKAFYDFDFKVSNLRTFGVKNFFLEGWLCLPGGGKGVFFFFFSIVVCECVCLCVCVCVYMTGMGEGGTCMDMDMDIDKGIGI